MSPKRLPPRSAADTRIWLQHRFGLAELRAQQAEVVFELLKGTKVFFIAPTGHGKSLCYQALAASPWSSGVVLVFQPLIALMNEQVERARERGLRAEFLNSVLSPEQQGDVLTEAVAGRLDILFLAPERQTNELWRERVSELSIKGVIIDEAHCISQWGHDFRPAYRQLVRTTMGLGLRTPVLAVTATAPAQVLEDVQSQIASHGDHVITMRLPSHRPNISCGVTNVAGFSERLAVLRQVAAQYAGQPGLAYLLTTNEVDVAADFLRSVGVRAASYHARLGADTREERIQGWRSGEFPVMCATSALGMGIDHSSIRWVLHLGLPDSLVRYVQEIGRAGRDGLDAFALAVADQETQDIDEWLLTSASPALADFREVASQIFQRGQATRTALIEVLDLPEAKIQKILDELVEGGWCEREGKPYSYAWSGGDPEDVAPRDSSSRIVRERFIDEMRAYAATEVCRSVTLAQAMGDTLNDACGACDICLGRTVSVDPATRMLAADFLDRFSPRLSGRGMQEGRALVYYKVGTLGKAIASSKYAGKPLSEGVLRRALEILADPLMPYFGVVFDMVACLPSRMATGPTFARGLAANLGCQLIVLEKTRDTDAQKRFRSKLLKERNVRDAFQLPAGTRLPSTVLLVDDIWDSGASMREAARLLSPAVVFPLTLARTRHTDGQ